MTINCFARRRTLRTSRSCFSPDRIYLRGRDKTPAVEHRDGELLRRFLASGRSLHRRRRPYGRVWSTAAKTIDHSPDAPTGKPTRSSRPTRPCLASRFLPIAKLSSSAAGSLRARGDALTGTQRKLLNRDTLLRRRRPAFAPTSTFASVAIAAPVDARPHAQARLVATRTRLLGLVSLATADGGRVARPRPSGYGICGRTMRETLTGLVALGTSVAFHVLCGQREVMTCA